MSARFSIEINQKDINKAVQALVKEDESVRAGLQKAIDIASLNIETGAKLRAPNNTSFRSRITRRNSPESLSADVVAGANYSAYIEFGTGRYAKSYLAGKPKWMQDYAWTFKRPKDGYSPARPFLFPSWEEERPKLIERIKRYLRK